MSVVLYLQASGVKSRRESSRGFSDKSGILLTLSQAAITGILIYEGVRLDVHFKTPSSILPLALELS